MTKHYLNEIGAQLILDTGMDLTYVSSIVIHVQRPDQTTTTWTGSVLSLNGLNNYITYTTIAGDLSQTGQYQIQPYLTFSNWQGYGETAHFIIYPQFD